MVKLSDWLFSCYHLRRSMEHHESVSMKVPPHSEARFCLGLGLRGGAASPAHYRWGFPLFPSRWTSTTINRFIMPRKMVMLGSAWEFSFDLNCGRITPNGSLSSDMHFTFALCEHRIWSVWVVAPNITLSLWDPKMHAHHSYVQWQSKALYSHSPKLCMVTVQSSVWSQSKALYSHGSKLCTVTVQSSVQSQSKALYGHSPKLCTVTVQSSVRSQVDN